MQNKIAIINTANRPWSVVDSLSLVNSWPDVEVREFYFSAIGRRFDASGLAIDASVNVQTEEAQLLEAVDAFQPTAIYLRVSPHTRSEYLVDRFRQRFPDLTLVVEFYDISTLFQEAALQFIFAADSGLVQRAKQACATAGRCADAIVVKMGGPVFDHWARDVDARVYTFFPSLSDSVTASVATNHEDASSSEAGRRVLYAGSVSARELNGGIGSVPGANVIRYFDACAEVEGCFLEIVNAAHGTAEEDMSPKFAALLERYDSSPQQYHYQRSLPRSQVVALANRFDMGICCAHYAEDEVMDVTRCGLPNRMMTYIEAQLPVIIDDRFDYAAELVETFEAGAVVPAGDIESFKRVIGELDLVRARSGIAALKAFMLEKNVATLASLYGTMVSRN